MVAQDDQSAWLTADEAAEVLHLSVRQTHRYGDNGRVQTKTIGRRRLFHAGDVARLADELKVDERAELLPRHDMAVDLFRASMEQVDKVGQQLGGRLDDLSSAQQASSEQLAAYNEQLAQQQALLQQLAAREPQAPKALIYALVFVGLALLVVALVVVLT